jgi:chemosensory pili system protein ChpA (sensor histidine kinase/response regulator)
VAQARMVPIGRLFARFARQVRDLGRSEGKAVTLAVSGETVEVDTRVIEEIADPVLHLVRNAVAHGLESEAERLAGGKPALGTISLKAVARGTSVDVEVADDGRGIDARALSARAVERGLLDAARAAELSERDALDLIFVPGLSTAAAVTEVSGRGVGMDVVRTNVSRLNGEIDIATRAGAGTRFTLRLPVSVAIADAVMVRAGTQAFAVPVSLVARVLEVDPAEVSADDAGAALTVDGERLRLVDLADTLGLPRAARRRRVPVAVVRAGRQRLALAVDALSGKEEIVVKPLDAFLEGEGPWSAATVTAEGRVVLLLDPARLLDGGRGIARRAVLPAAPPAPPVDAARRILLVDDSVSVRKFVGQMLERAGFHVTVAGDGEEALRALAERSVDLVVTDLEMPRVNGYELIRDLRRRPATRTVPIIVVTTRAGAKHADLARELGVQQYVTKPVDAERFLPLVAAVLHGEVAAR